MTSDNNAQQPQAQAQATLAAQASSRRDTAVTFRWPSATVNALKAAARADYRSASTVAWMAVEDYLSRRDSP